MTNRQTKNVLSMSALLAASLCTACASRQYGYGIETPGIASSGKAVIAKGGIDVATDSTFSEAAFLGSPIYIRHLSLTAATGAVNKASYEGAVSICIKKPLVWKRSNESLPAATGCGAGIQDLTVEINSHAPQAAAGAQCETSDCMAANADARRVFELRLPYDTQVRIAITDNIR